MKGNIHSCVVYVVSCRVRLGLPMDAVATAKIPSAITIIRLGHLGGEKKKKRNREKERPRKEKEKKKGFAKCA